MEPWALVSLSLIDGEKTRHYSPSDQRVDQTLNGYPSYQFTNCRCLCQQDPFKHSESSRHTQWTETDQTSPFSTITNIEVPLQFAKRFKGKRNQLGVSLTQRKKEVVVNGRTPYLFETKTKLYDYRTIPHEDNVLRYYFKTKSRVYPGGI